MNRYIPWAFYGSSMLMLFVGVLALWLAQGRTREANAAMQDAMVGAFAMGQVAERCGDVLAATQYSLVGPWVQSAQPTPSNLLARTE